MPSVLLGSVLGVLHCHEACVELFRQVRHELEDVRGAGTAIDDCGPHSRDTKSMLKDDCVPFSIRKSENFVEILNMRPQSPSRLKHQNGWALRNAQSPMLVYGSRVRVANKPFSFDLRLLVGSAVVLLCASARVSHSVVCVCSVVSDRQSKWQLDVEVGS